MVESTSHQDSITSVFKSEISQPKVPQCEMGTQQTFTMLPRFSECHPLIGKLIPQKKTG